MLYYVLMLMGELELGSVLAVCITKLMLFCDLWILERGEIGRDGVIVFGFALLS